MPDYLVRPYDVLFFRGNKSFYFGEWYAEGVFPPYPSTFQGFVRSKILFDNGLIDTEGRLTDAEKAKNAVGTNTEMKCAITGPYLMDEKTKKVYFKTPADLFRKQPHLNCCSSALRNIGNEMESDLDFPLSITEHPKEKLDNLYPPDLISLEELKQYRTLLNHIEVEDKELFVNEDRVIIGFDKEEAKKNNRWVQDKRFCVTQYKRLRDNMRFYCSVDKDIADGPLKLGSEAHPVYIQKMQDEDAGMIEKSLNYSRHELIDTILETKTFRMVLLQHGLFKNGWFPFDYRDPNSKKPCARVEGLDLKLRFAFTGQPIKISGYSFLKTKDKQQQSNIELKPVVHAVPAGAVYLFEITNDCTREAVEGFVNKYDNKSIEYKPYSQMGFNHLIFGVGPEKPKEVS